MRIAELLPVHGIVLAGGKSSRMGRDKASLPFCGRPMVEIAVEKLRSFCRAVSISGNREDFRQFAAVVPETRLAAGPAAGLEAGLTAASENWALFLPVDVPLVPQQLLLAWTMAALKREGDGVRLSYLRANGVRQPAFCLLHTDCLKELTAAINDGDLKLGVLFERVANALGPASVWMAEAETFVLEPPGRPVDVGALFSNVNTPEDLLALELWIRKPASAE